MKLKDYATYFARIYALLGITYFVIFMAISLVYQQLPGLGSIAGRAWLPALLVGTGIGLGQLRRIRQAKGKILQPADLEPEQRSQWVVQFEESELFAHLQRSLERIGWQIVSVQQQHGRQVWERSDQLGWMRRLTQGERITLQLTDFNQGYTYLSVHSKPLTGFYSLDDGRNAQNVQLVKRIVQSLTPLLLHGADLDSPGWDIE